jgi:iron complex outermembrane receptor protein
MLIRKSSLRICLIFMTIISFWNSISAQNKNEILFTTLLDTLSNRHQVFFTYNSATFANKLINKTTIDNKNLQETLAILQKNTPFHFDYLGNKYYVVYTKEDYEIHRKKNKSSNSPYFAVPFIIQNSQNSVKGVIIDTSGNPVSNAAIIQKETLNGTISDSDGFFNLNTTTKSPIEVRHIGYTTKQVPFNTDRFLPIILAPTGYKLDEIQIIGSRNKKRSAKDTPIAIDFIDLNDVSDSGEQVDINQLLENFIPSFNATKQSGADGADHIDPATIRGLGPDQTLVLINGKRRHQSSLINLYGTRGRGNSGTDLNAIPTSAIKRIELLRDGASAQYGSDAIAGVINIVLKDATNQLLVNSSFGFHNANSDTEKNNSKNRFDGETYKLGINYGVKIKKKGFINFSSEIISNNHTFRSSSLPREKFGTAAGTNYSLFFNSEIPINKKIKFYSNGGFSNKNTEAFAFTRLKNSERNVLSIYPNGFNPIIASKINDQSLSAGFLATVKKWNIDINNTTGVNNFKYQIKETLNATLENRSPTEFNAGGHKLIQNTTGIDFSKHTKTFLNGLNIAFGLEYRFENYIIFSGEEGSYAAYDIHGNIVTKTTPTANLITHNGKVRPGGSQGFPGYTPQNEVNKNRSNFSVYADTEFDFTKKWMVGAALRFENYNDFGNTLNYKLATRFKALPFLTFRSSFSTGFRAPSLAQIYYNLTFTNFIGNTPSESQLIANNNPIAREFNIDRLNEEKAINASFGFNAKLGKNVTATIDSYYVEIKDRIILTGNFDAKNLGFNVNNVQFFTNGVDTQTFGVDVVFNWKKQFENSKITISLAGNINEMFIDKIHNNQLDKETFFGVRDQYFLLASAPKNKFNLSFRYQHQKFSGMLSIKRYSSQKLIDWNINRPLSEFNNSTEEHLLKSTDYYAPKTTTNLHFSYKITNLFNFQIGATNLFNIYPTKQNQATDSGGYWDAVQMGSNGAYFYTKINLKL